MTQHTKSVARSALITVAMRWTARLIGFVSTLILARLLAPEDFGVIAMASLVIGLADVFFELGVNVALIQNKAPSQEHYDTAWTLRIIQTTLAAIIVVIAAPLAATYFNDPRVTLVVQVMAVSLMLSGLENIGVVTFQKEMQFGREFQFLFCKRIVGFIVTIAAAWFIRSYWALVIGALAGRTVRRRFELCNAPYAAAAWLEEIPGDFLRFAMDARAQHRNLLSAQTASCDRRST